MVWWQKECINKKQPWEGIQCAEDNTKMQQMRPGRKLCWHDNLHYRPSWTGTHIVPQQTSYIYCDLAHSQQPLIPHCLLLHEVNDLHCLPQAMWSILTHPLSYSAHLCCSVDSGSGQGPEAYWSASILSFHGLPTSYRLILSKRNPKSSCVST